MIVPPIRNFLLFRKSNWFSYHQAQKEIYENGGIVKKMGEGLSNGSNNANANTSANANANTRGVSAHIALEIDQKVIELDRKARERKV
jgi:hypothetical protein